MRKLVESLLALARGDEGAPLDPKPHDLAALVGETVQTTRAAAGGKVAIEYAPPGDHLVANFDQSRIRQAISILLDNAVKYTPEGGRVTVAARRRDDWVEVAVSDTGIGIPAEQLLLIFERFHRVDEARVGGGAGLGLAIARQVASAHGGEIEVESTPGEGSTFVLCLPLRNPRL